MQRTPSLTALFLAGAVALPAPGFAQAPACTQMQVFLSIAPKHREHVMDYIAPRLKQKLGVELVAEAIGSANMVERVTAQMPNPRISNATTRNRRARSSCAGVMRNPPAPCR